MLVTNSYTQVSHGGIRENTEDGLYEVLMQSTKPTTLVVGGSM